MKKLLCTLLFIGINSHIYAQTSIDKDLQAYIKTEGYVKLTDTANLPKTIMAWHAIIMTEARIKSFYVKLNTVRDNNLHLFMLVYPLDAIAFYKKIR